MYDYFPHPAASPGRHGGKGRSRKVRPGILRKSVTPSSPRSERFKTKQRGGVTTQGYVTASNFKRVVGVTEFTSVRILICYAICRGQKGKLPIQQGFPIQEGGESQ